MKFIAVFLVASSASFSLGLGLTEDEAVRIGVENSFGIKTAQSQLRQARFRTNQALAQLGFRLDGQAVYERYEPNRTQGGGSESDAKRASLSLSYPVDLAGLRGKALKAAKSNEAAVNDVVSVEENNIKEQIRRAYYSLLRAEWQEQVQTEALHAAKARLENTRLLYNQGSVARFDVLRFETDLSRAEAALTAAQNGVSLAKRVLNNAMGRNVDTEVDLDSPYENVREGTLPRYDLSEAALLERAFSTRAELMQLNHLLTSRKFITTTERGGLNPSLSLQALYLKTFEPGAFSRENQFTIGATLSFPIWDSGLTRARIATAKEDEKQTEIAIDRSKLAISLEVQSALAQIGNALAQVDFARKTVELQTEALRLAELRYNSGEGILLDVTTADADLRTALGALANARSDYLIAIAALRKSIGNDTLPLANP